MSFKLLLHSFGDVFAELAAERSVVEIFDYRAFGAPLPGLSRGIKPASYHSSYLCVPKGIFGQHDLVLYAVEQYRCSVSAEQMLDLLSDHVLIFGIIDLPAEKEQN